MSIVLLKNGNELCAVQKDVVKAQLDAEKEYYEEFAYNELKDSLENN